MRDEHLTNFPPSWIECRIGDVTLPVGKVDPKDDPDRPIDYIDISSIDNTHHVIGAAKHYKLGSAPSRARQIVRTGDVLFATVRPYLRNIASVPELYDGQVASTGFSILRPANGVHPSFLFYHAVSKDFVNALSGLQYGVSYPAVTDEQVRAQPIWLPPREEQQRIVTKLEELLSELDKGVENLETARKQLKVYRQAVLEHAFEGKFTEQWREENKDTLETGEQTVARLVNERKAHYQQELVQYRAAIEKCEAGANRGKKPSKPNRPPDLTIVETADLPELPEGWIWLRYGELCSVIRNGIAQKPEGNTGEKIFRISAVRSMEFDLNDVRYIANTSGEFDDYYLRTGDLVFTRYNGSRAYVGVCAEYKGDGTHLYPDKLIRTRLATSVTLSGYIEKAVNCGSSRDYIERRIRTTAGQSGISGSDIRRIPIPLCSPREQAIIRDRIDKELSKVSKLLSEIDDQLIKAEALRHSILRRAFSGRLVSQDPNDEPASVLLERIKAEKARSVLPFVNGSGNSRTTNTRKRTTVA